MTHLHTPEDAEQAGWDGPDDCCAHVGPLRQQLEQGGAEWTRMAEQHNSLQGALADMTRQRDEAVKAFQRERARVGRVQELERKWSEPTFASFLTGTHAAGDLRAALADRPTDD